MRFTVMSLRVITVMGSCVVAVFTFDVPVAMMSLSCPVAFVTGIMVSFAVTLVIGDSLEVGNVVLGILLVIRDCPLNE